MTLHSQCDRTSPNDPSSQGNRGIYPYYNLIMGVLCQTVLILKHNCTNSPNRQIFNQRLPSSFNR